MTDQKNKVNQIGGIGIMLGVLQTAILICVYAGSTFLLGDAAIEDYRSLFRMGYFGSVVLGAIAMVLGVIAFSKKEHSRGQAIAALVIPIPALALSMIPLLG